VSEGVDDRIGPGHDAGKRRHDADIGGTASASSCRGGAKGEAAFVTGGPSERDGGLSTRVMIHPTLCSEPC
jgi:hypothetical protein